MSEQPIMKSVPEVGRIVYDVNPARSYQMAAERRIPYVRYGKRMWSCVEWALERANELREMEPDNYVPPKKRKATEEDDSA